MRKGPARLVPLCALACISLAARPMQLEDTIAFRSIEAVAVSADGRWAAVCVESTIPGENRYGTDLHLVPVDGSMPERPLTHAPGGDCRPRFSPDGSRIAFLSDRGGSDQVWVIPVGGGEPYGATTHDTPIADFEWDHDGKALVFTATDPAAPAGNSVRQAGDDAWIFGSQWRAHRVWLQTIDDSERGLVNRRGAGPAPAARPLSDGTRHTERPAVSPDGRLIAWIAAPTPELDAAEEAIVQVLDRTTQAVTDVPGSLRTTAAAWSGDGRRLLFVAPFDGKGWSRADLFAWRPGDAAARNLSARLDRDVEDLRPAGDDGAFLLISQGARSEVVRASAAEAPQPVLRPGFPIGWPSPAGKAWLFVRLDRPHELWRQSPGREAAPLTRFNAALAATLDLPRLETVRWRSEGREIEGVLTVPPGAGGRAPLVIRPHGGPRTHSLMEFDPQAAWLASLGYLVLKPNFRGSTGYGDAFAKANGGDWGAGPFADIMAGADDLAAAGRVDPARMFLYGWSYGGIVANWAATHTDRFRAIISGAGVADLRMQYVLSDARRWRFDYFGGSPFQPEHRPAYEKDSPVSHVRSTPTPVLFLQGEKDRRCPMEQALMMHRALLDWGARSELVVYPREGHGFVEPAHILDRSRRVAAWFAAAGGPTAGAP